MLKCLVHIHFCNCEKLQPISSVSTATVVFCKETCKASVLLGGIFQRITENKENRITNDTMNR